MQKHGATFAQHSAALLFHQSDMWVPFHLAATADKFNISKLQQWSARLQSVTLNGLVKLIPAPRKVKDKSLEDSPELARFSWFITRNCPASQDIMWAGKVVSMYHLPPIRKASQTPYDIVIRADWYAPQQANSSSSNFIDSGMNLPIVEAKPRAMGNGIVSRFYLAADVAPVRVFAVPHWQGGRTSSGKPKYLCILSKSFSFMRVAGWDPLPMVTKDAAELAATAPHPVSKQGAGKQGAKRKR